MAKLTRHPPGHPVTFTNPTTGDPIQGRIVDEVWAVEPDDFGPLAPDTNDGWREAAFARPRLLAGRPVGVVGAGYVGRRVIGMLRALRAELLVYDPYLKDDLGASPVGLEELFA